MFAVSYSKSKQCAFDCISKLKIAVNIFIWSWKVASRTLNNWLSKMHKRFELLVPFLFTFDVAWTKQTTFAGLTLWANNIWHKAWLIWHFWIWGLLWCTIFFYLRDYWLWLTFINRIGNYTGIDCSLSRFCFVIMKIMVWSNANSTLGEVKLWNASFSYPIGNYCLYLFFLFLNVLWYPFGI